MGWEVHGCGTARRGLAVGFPLPSRCPPLSCAGLCTHHSSPSFLPSFTAFPEVLLYPPGSSSRACSLLAEKTLRTAVLASSAQGSYNYSLIYLLTTSYNYTELFLLKRKMLCPALLLYSLLLGRAQLASSRYFHPVIFLSCNLLFVGVRNMAQENFIRWPVTNGPACLRRPFPCCCTRASSLGQLSSKCFGSEQELRHSGFEGPLPTGSAMMMMWPRAPFGSVAWLACSARTSEHTCSIWGKCSCFCEGCAAALGWGLSPAARLLFLLLLFL